MLKDFLVFTHSCDFSGDEALHRVHENIYRHIAHSNEDRENQVFVFQVVHILR